MERNKNVSGSLRLPTSSWSWDAELNCKDNLMLWSELKEMNCCQDWKGILKGRRAPGEWCPLWSEPGCRVHGRGLGCRKQPVLYSSCPCYRACRSLVPLRAFNCAAPSIHSDDCCLQMICLMTLSIWSCLGKIFLVSPVPFIYATLLWIVSAKAKEHSFVPLKPHSVIKNRDNSIYFVQDMQIFNCLHFISCYFFLCYLLNSVFPGLFFCALYEILCHKHQIRTKRKLCAGNIVHA